MAGAFEEALAVECSSFQRRLLEVYQTEINKSKGFGDWRSQTASREKSKETARPPPTGSRSSLKHKLAEHRRRSEGRDLLPDNPSGSGNLLSASSVSCLTDEADDGSEVSSLSLPADEQLFSPPQPAIQVSGQYSSNRRGDQPEMNRVAFANEGHPHILADEPIGAGRKEPLMLSDADSDFKSEDGRDVEFEFIISTTWLESNKKRSVHGGTMRPTLLRAPAIQLGQLEEQDVVEVQKPTWWERPVLVQPNSSMNAVFDGMRLLFILLDLFWLPLLAFSLPQDALAVLVDWLQAIFWTIDIFISSQTGYRFGGKCGHAAQASCLTLRQDNASM
eukprot:TRINITY_DN91764_c0_g1_i1.p1 TRINITY_DN91764_c0_g1~~TRINITY_DN91764_c0_g1_i1.p1  ORF type:complete len:346 (+),score=72.48 TRINITY_DN91764_c0_g1_i1:42-1040(+)